MVGMLKILENFWPFPIPLTEAAGGNFTWGGGGAELIKCIDPNEGEALGRGV